MRQLRNDYTLFFHSPYEAFLIHLKTAVCVGVIGATPFFLIELWLFVTPGLHAKERRALALLALFSVLFFLGGAAFAFWILVPWALQFFLNFQTPSLQPLLGIGPYFSFLLGTVWVSGLLFDLPVVALGLVKMGILKGETLRNYRKGVIVTLFLLAAVLTPSGDPASQILVALPLLLLYEVCIWVARWVEPKKGSPS